MLKEYTREELRDLYRKLPEDIKESMSSEHVTDAIYNTCERNEVEDAPKVTKIIALVILGVLPPESLPKTFHEELNLSVEVSEKVSQEINRFIFYPIKDHLSAIYGKEISPVPLQPGETIPSEEKPVSKKVIPPRKDTYRESIGEE